MFNVVVREQAAKRLSRLPEPYFSSIKQEIVLLQKDYFPKGKKCKRLQGKEKDLYRLRIGSYRVLYHVSHKTKTITILRIFSRSEGY